MALLSVEEALQRILDGVTADRAESVAIEAGARPRAGRAAARAASRSRRSMPPPWTATRCAHADVAQLPATLAVIGEAAAGHPFAGRGRQGEAVRIFTGAPVPEGADAIVIQENTERDGGQRRRCAKAQSRPGHIRTSGLRFPRRRHAARRRAAAGPARDLARRRHGTRAGRGAPPPPSPSFRPATSWCRRAAGPVPARSSPPITWAWPRWRKPPAASAAAARHRPRHARRASMPHFARARRRRRHRHHRRRVGRRSRPRRAGRCRRAA